METAAVVKKLITSNTTSTVGRRKEAVARIRISPGKGLFTINGKPVTEYFAGAIFQKRYNKPTDVTNTAGNYQRVLNFIW